MAWMIEPGERTMRQEPERWQDNADREFAQMLLGLVVAALILIAAIAVALK
jgi:hypothetical protein